MTVSELLNGVIYAGTLAAALTGIGAFFHFALVRPMRSFLRKEIGGLLTDIKVVVEDNTAITDNLHHLLQEHIESGGHVHSDG